MQILSKNEQEVLAEQYGFELIPNKATRYSFKLGNVVVWQSRQWCVARLINGVYQDHQYRDILEDALQLGKLMVSNT